MTLDITEAPIHLGRRGAASPVEDFDWSESRLAAYDRATARRWRRHLPGGDLDDVFADQPTRRVAHRGQRRRRLDRDDHTGLGHRAPPAVSGRPRRIAPVAAQLRS